MRNTLNAASARTTNTTKITRHSWKGCLREEKIPLDELDHKPSWYIPHHGIYHPNKPDKIRVVFDCSAKCQGESLNAHLLQGPDLTNSLTGVLIRFREKRVAFMCDVENMFHQFRVDTQDRNYLRFLWMGEDYRMTVHLFGASSSPACPDYGLKQIANDYGQDSSGAAHFVGRNFYVDDGLTSVDSIEKAKTLIKQTREMCARGNLRVHKFVSNSIEVLESVPSSERATDLKDLDPSLEYMPVERAPGIQWCVEDYRMTVHLFGASSSPACANYGLKQIANDYGQDSSRIWIRPWNTCLSKEHLGCSGALNLTASSFDLRSRIGRAHAVAFCPRLPLFTTHWGS